MVFVEIPCKSNFDFTDEFSKTGKLFTEMRHLTIGNGPAISTKTLNSIADVLVAELAFRKHSHHNVEVVSHQAKSQNFHKVQSRIAPDQIKHEFFFNIAQWKSIQRRSGHHMIDGGFIPNNHSRCSGHRSSPAHFSEIRSP